jgi:uncharacterized protein YbbC (DUF1343 family)
VYTELKLLCQSVETTNKLTRIKTELGLERLLNKEHVLLKDLRIGLICNQASVDHAFHHAADLCYSHPDIRLTALFGPQHGIRGDVQDNMIESEHAVDPRTGLPVYSLYSETREPTSKMLEGIDAFIFDMQDVGCRIYTFIYTLANCMRAAAQYGKKVIVCDRPNPINGTSIDGNTLVPGYESFVGQFPIPTRHGMTVGELAQLFNNHFNIGCDLSVIKMAGWHREMWIDDTDAPWVMPSPNMPTLDTATVFPGTVHFEGTQLSEGRGTTRPFELIGAPYINADAYATALNALDLGGVYFRPCGFQPTFQKHAGQTCGGVQIHVLDRETFNSVRAGIACIKIAYEMYYEDFRWKAPPYEYVYDRNPFDVICGTDSIRVDIEKGNSLASIFAKWEPELEAFQKTRSDYLLY